MKIYTLLAPILIAGLVMQSPSTLLSMAGEKVASTDKGFGTMKGYPSNFTMKGVLQGWGTDATGLWLTEDGGISWRHPFSNIVPIPKETRIYEEAYFFLNASNGWVLTSYGTGQPILIFHTSDQGKSWKSVRLPVTEEWERGYSGGFIHFVDKNNGYVLLNSEPALGFMEKSLYRTADGGLNWKRLGNLTRSIEAYPTGMTFQNAQNGWITSSNHGQDYILTFRTSDGGKNWKTEKLKKPPALEAFTYSNSYPPVFSGENSLKGVMPLEIVDDGIRSMVYYRSEDGGNTWVLGQQLQGTEAAKTTWLNAREGWALQEGGNLLSTVNGGASWKVVAKSALFDKVESIQFATSKNGWVTGPGFLQHTVDGGRTWRPLVSK